MQCTIAECGEDFWLNNAYLNFPPKHPFMWQLMNAFALEFNGKDLWVTPWVEQFFHITWYKTASYIRKYTYCVYYFMRPSHQVCITSWCHDYTLCHPSKTCCCEVSWHDTFFVSTQQKSSGFSGGIYFHLDKGAFCKKQCWLAGALWGFNGPRLVSSLYNRLLCADPVAPRSECAGVGLLPVERLAPLSWANTIQALSSSPAQPEFDFHNEDFWAVHIYHNMWKEACIPQPSVFNDIILEHCPQVSIYSSNNIYCQVLM